jgi:RNA-binding protein 39
MKNAFNPEEETERDWDTELAEDVKGECEEKYGRVLDIYVNKESVVCRLPILSRPSVVY